MSEKAAPEVDPVVPLPVCVAEVAFAPRFRTATSTVFTGTFVLAASTMGVPRPVILARVVLPAALPSIFTGLRLGLGLAWFVIVVGEMTGVPQGLGAVIMDGRTLSRTELVICGMIVIGLAGYLSDRAVVAAGNRLLRWRPTHHG